MGAKKRNTAVDRQPRPANVKTRLTANKTGTVSTTANKPQKAAAKKSLPHKKRISKEKSATEEAQDTKSRSTSKSKITECESSTIASGEVKNEKKITEPNAETEADSKQTPKDGKTKAISKMLKNLDIQISGFTNILPPEEKIIEVLKSSISENVKTKSRATAVKGNTNNALGKFSGKKDHVERKPPYSSSSSNSPNVSFEHDSKDGISKKEASVSSTSQTVTSNEDVNSKETIYPEQETKLEEPVIETKKKMAAKKAKLEASRSKKKQEELREEEKSTKPEEIARALNKNEESSEQMRKGTENERRKYAKPKSSRQPSEEEIAEKRKAESDAMKQANQERSAEKEYLEDEEKKTKCDIASDKESLLLVKNEIEQDKSKQANQQGKERDSSVQRKCEESQRKKKQTKPSQGTQQGPHKETSEQKKNEQIQEKKKPLKTVKGIDEECSETKNQGEVDSKKKQAKPTKGAQHVGKDLSRSDSTPQKKTASPKKTKQTAKVLKGKCNEGETQVTTPIAPEISSNTSMESTIKIPSAADCEAKKPDLNEIPKKAKSLTILQRLQNKYKMSPVKSKPSAKPVGKKVEVKGSAKKPPDGKSSEEQKKNDIYDFKSGSESEENIKMDLPTLKKLREFSDDDDKPLQVAKKKLKEDQKPLQQIVEKPEPKAETKLEKNIIKTTSKNAIAAEKKAPAKTGRKPQAKVKRPPTESSSDAISSTPTDSEDEQKLSTFGQKRYRMASLNAAAKVQCLYENESRTAYELGLSKTVQVIPKIRNINSGSSSEEEKETKPSIKREPVAAAKETKKVVVPKVEPTDEADGEEKEEEVEVETKRELRNVPGRGMGKHWEFESDTDNEAIFIEKLRMKKKKLQKLKALQAKKEKKEKDKDKDKEKDKTDERPTKPKKPVKPPKKSVKVKVASSDDGSSESSDHEEKKKTMNPPPEKPAPEPKKKRKRELKEELIGDYKGILARKRMASLNASAIVAATYEVERHLDRNFASDCSSFESFPEEEKHVSKKSKKLTAVQSAQAPQPTAMVETKDLKEAKDIKIDPSECSDTKDSLKDFKDSVQDAKETSRPTSSSLVIVQDTDVTITGVYVNPTTGSSQEAFCKMQYRVQSSVTEERVLRPGSVEPPKSYTPLGALSSMRPPGAATGTDDRSTPPTPVDSAPPIIAESISHPNIYQPNDLSHHEPSEHSHYSYHHHMSPSPMSLHPHPADHASQMHHYVGHQPGVDAPPPQALSAHHYHTPQQPPLPPPSMSQGRCESPVRYGGGYQAQHPTLSMTAGGGSSAFCAPPSMQQQQQQQQQRQQHHDMSGYYQPAGPLISPHVLPPVTAQPPQSLQQSNLPPVGTKSKQIPLDPDIDRGQLQPPPSSTSTVESSDSDVLITGGDLTTFRYPSQQQDNSQAASIVSQQQSQQQLHHQQAAGAAAHQGAPPYPRSMHQMHYTSAYPPNYYSPYPGEAMCYSPPYQPFFPAKVYQSAPPPPSYRRYPPYYQPGPHSGPPPSADLYEQPPPSGGQPPPSGPPLGTQLVPAGPVPAHTQHLEHYPGPPGYYSGYSPGGGGQCYARSPYMEYPQQCPCPMQQSCPKNVHTGPHIGSNTISGSNNTSSSNNNTINTEATTNSTISNPTVTTAATMTPVVSGNIIAAENSISKSASIPNSKNNSNDMLPVSDMLHSSGIVNTNNVSNQQQQLNISRGPVTNNNSNTIHQQLVVATERSVTLDGGAATNAHHHFLHHPHHHTLLHHHHVQSCGEMELLKPLKSELKSEEIDIDSKSQYEEDVIQPLTPPLDFEKPTEEVIELEKESEKNSVGDDGTVCTVEAFDLTVSPASPKNLLPTPLVLNRKARIGKTMAREMVYAGSAAKHNPLRLQQMQQTPVHFTQQQSASHGTIVPALNLSSHSNSSDKNNFDRKCDTTVNLILETKIKSEKIKTEKDEELSIVLPRNVDDKEYLNKIKTEPDTPEDIKVASLDSVIDDDLEITSPAADGPKQRIKILEFHKNQCKKSSPNSYKSLIKQTEPKSYLCLSRKIEKRNRFGKFKKSSRNSVVRKRKLVLTDQQKKSLRIRKKKLVALEEKKEKIREKKRLAAVAQRIERRQAARKEKLKQSLLLSTKSMGNSREASGDLIARGYFSEPETRCTSSCPTTAGRKVKKSKTAEARSKSETKKPSASLLKPEPWECFSSTSSETNRFPTTSTTILSPETDKSRSHKKHKSLTGNKKSSKTKSLYNNNSSTVQTEASILSGRLSECEFVHQNQIPNNGHAAANNNNSSEANNNEFSKTPLEENPLILSDEAITDLTPLSSNSATLSVPQQPPSEFVFLRPAIPRFIRHNGSMKRIRSRSKFGSRKKQKHKHSISIEVDETIQPTRPDVVPKWNNGWRWEGEPFQGAVFLNSDDPHVIRTCYPAMRHSEGDIIRPRDCVLLKANEDNELPYVAKVAYLWENPEDGEMMMSLLWYYRPEHTERGRLTGDCPDEVYASRHRDHNSVACIEDKCYVLVFREYCRYRRRLRAAEEDIQDVSIVPKRPNFFNPRAVPESTNPELVMFCRRAYEFRTKRLLKMPNKHDNVTRSSN